MVMPKPLRDYWAKHGRGSSNKGGSRSGTSRSPINKPSMWSRIKAGLKPADPLSMALFGAAGYLLPNALTATGLPWAAYQASQGASSKVGQAYSKAVDYLYNAGEQVSQATGAPNPWVNGGASGWGKIAGVMLAGDIIAKSAKTGHLSNRALNVEGPLSLGLILDPPSGGSAGGSSVSEDGW